MTVVIEEARSLDDFIRFPLDLFRSDPLFVPQLTREMRTHFSDRNPFFRNATARYLLARTNGRIAGRVVSFVNRRHNEFHHDGTGFFGFFDCINDGSVAQALLEAAAAYLKEEGMTFMRGPMNFSTNEECGFLLEGFDEPPMIMMPYNPPYYNDLMQHAGLEKAKDLFAYIYDTQETMPGKVYRVAEIARKRGLKARPIRMKDFDAEMKIFKEVYHSAWQHNWGFIPMTEEELKYAGDRLKQIIVPDLTMIAEKDGMPVGFLGLIPDFNMVLKKMNSKLNPLTIAKALYFSRKIQQLRLLLLGINQEYRNKGVEALMFCESFKGIRKGGYRRLEFSWILEDNIPVQNIIAIFGGRIYKKYRVYEKAI